MSDEKKIPQRLKELREASGLTVRAMAKLVGKSPSGYLHYENPDRFKDDMLPLKEAQAFAEALATQGVDRSEVLVLAGVTSNDGVTELIEEGSSLVSVYNVEASAGGGALVASEDAVTSLAFPPGYLNRLTTTSPQYLSIIAVKGDSMLPTLSDDDLVMVDTSKRDLSYDGIFVIKDNGDALLVKRIGRASQRGRVSIISDNRDIYPAVERSQDEIEVIGRVIWSAGKI